MPRIDPALAGIFNARNQTQQGGFSGTVGAQYRERVTRLDPQMHIAQDMLFQAPAVIGLADILKNNHR